MKFGPVPVGAAQGAVLAHSIAIEGGRLRKGLVLEAAHLDALTRAGLHEVTVARIGPGDVGEDEAATRLAAAILGVNPAATGLRASLAATGRVNLYSQVKGVAQVDRGTVEALNAVDPMITLATVPEWRRMGQGGMVATVKIISYAVPGDVLARVCALADAAIRMRPAAIETAALVQTVAPGEDGEKGHRALHKRLEALGVRLGDKTVVAHEVDALARALRNAQAEVLFILTGSATSDIDDVAPKAVRAAGGQVTRFGMPVDPGNLLFIGEHAGRPVIGLPGCARSPALNGADWVMERILCGVPVTGSDIARMGVGGLLKEIPQRGHPREP